MLTILATVLWSILKWYLIFECAVAVFIIMEGMLNIHLGIRSTYIKLLTRVFQFGNKRVQNQLPSIERTQKPERVWSALAADSQVLDDDEVHYKPLDVEVDSNGQPTDFKLKNVLPLIRSGIKDIVEDQVTKAFDAEELPYWNMLTRTNKGYQYISFRLSVIWFTGFWFRHFVLFPIRVLVVLAGELLLLGSAMVCGRVPDGAFRSWLARYATKISYRILARALSLHATYHDRKNMAKNNGVCVANHTSPIDVVILSCDHVYAFVGQLHGGPFGFLQREIGRAFSHIWFDRAESKDRSVVANRMKAHVKDPNKPTILIFPEGACVNNTTVLMFKKGGFELDCPVYPVAIRYNPLFGDAFWGNQPTMQGHIYDMLTSWAIVCQVWYLPAMTKLPEEDSATFANRVKVEIAKKGGMVDIDWDPRFYPENKKPEDSRWRKQQQKVISDTIIQRNTKPTASVVPETFPETATVVKDVKEEHESKTIVTDKS